MKLDSLISDVKEAFSLLASGIFTLVLCAGVGTLLTSLAIENITLLEILVRTLVISCIAFLVMLLIVVAMIRYVRRQQRRQDDT